MDGSIIAEGLAFPEGPVWVDGALYVTEIAAGRIARWTPQRGLERIADTGGGPNGATLGADGALYVTQNGGVGREPKHHVPGAIQRVTLDGIVSTVTTSVAGYALGAPNDLAFGPDGRLYFTDPRGEPNPAENNEPGRLFAYDLQTGTGELRADVGLVFPNGIGFAPDGSLLWTESYACRVMRMGRGGPEVVFELPEMHFPDGYCLGADGRFYVASTYAHCVSVVDRGVVVDRLLCGEGMCTNCCFGGTDLYVTESRFGTLWRFALGVAGQPLLTGRT